MSLVDLLGEFASLVFDSGGAPGGPGPWTGGGAGPAMGGNGPSGGGGQGGGGQGGGGQGGGGQGGGGQGGGGQGGGGQGGPGGPGSPGNQGPGDDDDQQTDDEKAIDDLTPDLIDIIDLIKDIFEPGPPSPGPGPVDLYNWGKAGTEAAKAGMQALKREKKIHDYLNQDFKGAHKDFGE